MRRRRKADGKLLDFYWNDDGQAEESDGEDADVYDLYEVQHAHNAGFASPPVKHPSGLVETAPLATTKITMQYRFDLASSLNPVVAAGYLSDAQVDSVYGACNAHQHFILPSPSNQQGIADGAAAEDDGAAATAGTDGKATASKGGKSSKAGKANKKGKKGKKEKKKVRNEIVRLGYLIGDATGVGK